MGKVISIAVGAIVAIGGFILLVNWFGEFKLILKGSVPVFLILGGAIACIAGISELKDSLKSGKPEAK